MRNSVDHKRFAYKPRQTQPATKNGFNWAALTTLVSVSVPLLYVIGRVYDEFYLGTYGISSDLFPRSTQDYLYLALGGIFSAIHSIRSFEDGWAAFAWALGMSAYVGFLLWFGNLKLSPWLRNSARKIITTRTARILGVLSSGPILVGMGWVVLTFIFVVLLLPIFIGYSTGKRVALEEIQKDAGVCIAKKRDDLKACVVVTRDGRELMTGRIIAASDSIIAIASEGRVTIFSRDNLKIESQHLH